MICSSLLQEDEAMWSLQLFSHDVVSVIVAGTCWADSTVGTFLSSSAQHFLFFQAWQNRAAARRICDRKMRHLALLARKHCHGIGKGSVRHVGTANIAGGRDPLPGLPVTSVCELVESHTSLR